MPRFSRPFWLCCSIVTLLLAPGCGGEIQGDPPQTDGGGVKLNCDASTKSGLWLLAFGPVSQELNTDGSARISVVVTRGSAEGQGNGAAGQNVAFSIITAGSDAKLSTKSATTDVDGLAHVTFTAGKKAELYQVTASVPGTCTLYFSLDVKKALRQLRSVTPSPLDTFTNAVVPVAVEASTDGNARIKDEEITFTFAQGSSGETKLSSAGSGGTSTFKVKTNGMGRATVMVATGSKPIAALVVRARMTGTADADVVVRVMEGSSKTCTGDWECPLGYACKGGKCQAQPTTPTGGCTKDADCAPNTCDLATGQCVAPTPVGGCKKDTDCTPPYICQISTGKCLKPTGGSCDPIEGTGCKTGEICVGMQCATLPKSCTDNSTCPTGFKCQNGKCVPQGKPTTGGCVTNADCPGGVCVNGVCKAKKLCTIAGKKPDRLKGRWKYDSTLHLRQALSGFLKGFLTASGVLNTIINGSFNIKGVPSFIQSVVKKYIKKLVGQYVPSWAQTLVSTLSGINDIVDDMRILSTVQKTSAGNDRYICSEQWDLIEFSYGGKKISSPPSAIPQIGQVAVSGYTANEVCGVLYIQKHSIKNKVGGIIHWAINTALALVTCNVKGSPCFNSVTQALQTAINCPMLAMQLDQLVQSVWAGAPSVASIVSQGCQSEKTKLIQQINKSLNDLSVKLSLLQLSGTVTIPVPGLDQTLSGGKWHGVLGSGAAKGNFNGDFTAKKMP